MKKKSSTPRNGKPVNRVKKEQLNVRIEPKLLKQLRDVAAAERRDLVVVVELALEAYFGVRSKVRAVRASGVSS